MICSSSCCGCIWPHQYQLGATRDMAPNKCSSLSHASSTFSNKNHSSDVLQDKVEVPFADASVEKVKDEATEGQVTATCTISVPNGRSVNERDMCLELNERNERKPGRKYGIFRDMPISDPGPPPDGGTIAWLQVLAGHLMCFITWGLITSFGVFQSYYEETLRLEPSAVSWIGTTQIFTLLLIGTFSGRASDAGLVHETVFMGTFLIVFGTFMTSLSTQYYQLFLCQGTCVGLGMGVLYMPGLSVRASYFKEKKSVAVAIIASGAGSGGLVYPAMVQQLLPRIGLLFCYPQTTDRGIDANCTRICMDSSLHGLCHARRCYHD